jgi:hypothetical protein
MVSTVTEQVIHIVATGLQAVSRYLIYSPLKFEFPTVNVIYEVSVRVAFVVRRLI